MWLAFSFSQSSVSSLGLLQSKYLKILLRYMYIYPSSDPPPSYVLGLAIAVPP